MVDRMQNANSQNGQTQDLFLMAKERITSSSEVNGLKTNNNHNNIK